MKKNIISALLLLFTASAMAQGIDTGYRWYAQAHINGSYSSNEDLRYDPLKFSDALAWGGDLAVGYNFNDFWGLYLEVAYNNNKGAQDLPIPGQPLVLGANIKDYKFKSIEPSLNVSYNLTSGFCGYKPNRKNNWYLHAGLGYAFGFDYTGENLEDKQQALFGRLGLNYVHNFNNWIALTADITGNLYDDKFSGRVEQVAVDGRINLGIGLRVYLSKSTKPAYEVVYRDDVIVKHDTIRVREEVVVNDQEVYPIMFDTNKSDIQSAKISDLKKVADYLKANPKKVVYVLGYAEKGTENDALAAERATAVTNELAKTYGIDASRIITHRIGTKAQPYTNQASNNRSTICIITDLKHY